MPKNIVLFADGTGNSAAKLFKTNVWRLYQALDVSDSSPDGQPRQIAFYHDGVGTSSFKPLAILGGVFGIGLKRNVREIYAYLCRNYNPGDRIYAFGFSRGAFTIRVLTGLVISQGVLRCETEEELARYTADAYRAYRRGYKLPLFGRKDKTEKTDPTATVGLVDRIRDARDAVIAGWRKTWRQRQFAEIPRERVKIEFIGVWDTVAAYGLPVDELTRGIDEWVWPLSMPNYILSPDVLTARHALSLDDERDSFHPLLWDEVAEEKLIVEGAVARGRLQQVWFAGVHSNVGGGYADDSLSNVALEWMMGEAGKAGLRYIPPEQRDIRVPANPFGRLYDSRRGLAAYYRYQPRKISARLDPPSDPATAMMQNPNRRDPKGDPIGFLKRVQVHESVLHRIQKGDDRYAPIVLPAEYEVVTASGGTIPHPEKPVVRADRQEWVWNDVWRRRVNYFMTVGVSAVLVLLPWTDIPSACVGPQCLLSPVIVGAGQILPAFLQSWIRAYANAPGTFAVLVILIFALMARSAALNRRIRDGARELWAQALNLPLGPDRPKTKAGLSTAGPSDWIYKLRSSPAYQRFFQALKWRLIPGLFGFALLAGGILLIVGLPVLVFYRSNLAWAERSGRVCAIGTGQMAPQGQPAGTEPVYLTSSLCWATGHWVEKNQRYRLTLVVRRPWQDAHIPATPAGFGNDQMAWGPRYVGVLLRRSMTDRWFQPILRIVRPSGRARLQALEMRCACGTGTASGMDAGRGIYTADFRAVASGQVSLFVNDAIISWFGLTDQFYKENNLGEAEVRLERIESRTDRGLPDPIPAAAAP